MTKILDGRAVAVKILEEAKAAVLAAPKPPSLVIFQIGDNPASTQYVTMKQRKAFEIGIQTEIIHLSDTFGELMLYELIREKTMHVSGTMLQLPLPDHLVTRKLLDAIPAEKDVDGISTENLNELEKGCKPRFAPAVAIAIAEIIKFYEINLQNKDILVIGKGIYVGKPIGELLQLEFSPSSPIHWIDEYTTNPEDSIKEADIVISCVGKPHIYNASQLKKGAILIDVGTSEDPESKKIIGDFDTTEAGHLSAYTPVPGGVGPATVASLLRNVASSSKDNAGN